jgi:hypothetical protein
MEQLIKMACASMQYHIFVMDLLYQHIEDSLQCGSVLQELRFSQ